MTGGRSQLLQLRRDREAAGRTVELLEDKYEALMREIATRKHQRDQHRLKIARQWTKAWTAMRMAAVESGSGAIAAAALAQPPPASIPVRRVSLLGTQLLREPEMRFAFQPRYDMLDSAVPVDHAGIEFTALVPELVRLGQMEANLKALRRSLRKTLRLLNGVEKVLIPRVDNEIRVLAMSLEEEERDEYSRLRLRPRS